MGNLGITSQSRLGLGLAGVMSWMSFDAVGMDASDVHSYFTCLLPC
jgi:hypothetical protein